jgi:predicted N-acetyltransferase YhbS
MQPSEPAFCRELGDGLLLRWSRREDADAVAALFADVFRENVEQPLNTHFASWAHDMFSGRHPLTGPEEFALVEDRQRRTIVAAASFLNQTWEYEGIAFGVGRPETVATHAEYRNRGLVRAIFELLHARSAARGHLAQAITGIPYFYRQFGYEYALDLGGGKSVYFDALAPGKEGQAEPYTLRDAAPADVALLERLYRRELESSLTGGPPPLSARVEERYWRYLIDGISPTTGVGFQPLVIEDPQGQAHGYLLRWRSRWNASVGLSGMMLVEGVALSTVLPSVLRGLREQAPRMLVTAHAAPPATRLHLNLRDGHPVYALLAPNQTTPLLESYAWYVRIPDLPAFLRQIGPALERRLENSPMAGYSGELKITFYREGLRLVFEGGRISGVEPWRTPPRGESQAQAGFPPLVFTQLLLGHRSLAELRFAFPDVWVKAEHVALVEALFPRRQAWVLPLD